MHVKNNVCDEAINICLKQFVYGFTLFGGLSAYKRNISSAITPRLYISRYWTKDQFEEKVNEFIKNLNYSKFN